MGFKKGESGNPEGRPKGSLNKTTNEIREFILKTIDSDKIAIMLNQIENPIDYINAISKLLPYVASKVKPTDIIQEEDKNIVINIVPYDKD